MPSRVSGRFRDYRKGCISLSRVAAMSCSERGSVLSNKLYATDDAGHEHGPFKSVKHAIEVLQIPGKYESIASGISHCFKENGNSYGYKWRRSTDN